MIKFADDGSDVQVTGGELHGIYEARDSVITGFLDGLNDFSATLAFEFNKLYSQGEGIAGFSALTISICRLI